MKDFERAYRERGPYHHLAKGFERWWLTDNYRLLARYVRQDDRVLDLACGDGRFSTFISHAPIVGIDNSPTAIELASRCTRTACVVGDMRALPFAHASFDVVICSLSFQYIIPADLLTTLAQIKQVLTQSGRLVFSYPNVNQARRRAATNAAVLTMPELFSMLDAVGFRIRDKWGICLPNPGFLARRSTRPLVSPIAYLVYRLSTIGYYFPERAYHYVVCCNSKHSTLNIHYAKSVADFSTLSASEEGKEKQAMKCYICESSSVIGGCRDCGGLYCSEHGVPSYCVVCTLKHDEPEPLRRALTFDIWLGFRPPHGELEEKEVAPKRALSEKVVQRLLDMLHDPDYMVRYRVVYVLGTPYFERRVRGDEPVDARIMESLAKVVYENRNKAVRIIARKVLKQYYEYYGHRDQAKVPIPLLIECIRKAWVENKVRWPQMDEDRVVWLLNVITKEAEQPEEHFKTDIRQELQRDWEKYVDLDVAIAVILNPEYYRQQHSEYFKGRGSYTLSRKQHVEWAEQTLASASREDIKVCLRRAYYGGHVFSGPRWATPRKFSEKIWPLKWVAIKGSILEQNWMEADLPTSEVEDKQARETPEERLHVAENYDDPLYRMVDAVLIEAQ